MYVIHIGQRAEHRTTLAGVLQYLNEDRDGKAAPWSTSDCSDDSHESFRPVGGRALPSSIQAWSGH